MTTFGGDETTLAADAATAPERDWRSVQPVGRSRAAVEPTRQLVDRIDVESGV
jgi:hypothetical protein